MIDQFAQKAEELFPAVVTMISGCKDSQTSADVGDTSSFGLSCSAGPGGAGGACTNALVKALEEKQERGWVELLERMQTILREGQYEQIPQLSSSRAIDLKAPFRVLHPQPGQRRRALMVGINYVGSSAELSGCHNDVETMRRYLFTQGYQDSEFKFLLDDGKHESPTLHNIEKGIQWLVDGASASDSLFFHYSGHGTQIKDQNGDEADGMDEALCPVDFETSGMLRDDDLYKTLVKPLGEGVQLTCLIDCCHSATVLDLPYRFKADDESINAFQNGDFTSMLPNEAFDAVAIAALAVGVTMAVKAALDDDGGGESESESEEEDLGFSDLGCSDRIVGTLCLCVGVMRAI
eukprot:TRINITY_DN9267_c0_g1_i5.p1 TRINITY_DN9267_c0_g1~~TRINITY_DN9267_c0_g1_i5.p1  ORF type:complete len:350 (-),score=48.20 TRINITY_DN9267_c0_g1_i5:272-1321(-)